MKALYEAYHDKAVILVVYVREAHPANSEQTADNAGWKAIDGEVFYQPKTYEERRKLAETACTFWELPIPTLVDTMDPSIGATYQAWPNRTYLIDTDGKIVARGVKGPRGVNVHQCELDLREMLGITEGELVTKAPAARSAPSGRGRLGPRPAVEIPAETDGASAEKKEPWWQDGDKKESDAKKDSAPEGDQ